MRLVAFLLLALASCVLARVRRDNELDQLRSITLPHHFDGQQVQMIQSQIDKLRLGIDLFLSRDGKLSARKKQLAYQNIWPLVKCLCRRDWDQQSQQPGQWGQSGQPGQWGQNNGALPQQPGPGTSPNPYNGYNGNNGYGPSNGYGSGGYNPSSGYDPSSGYNPSGGFGPSSGYGQSPASGSYGSPDTSNQYGSNNQYNIQPQGQTWQ